MNISMPDRFLSAACKAIRWLPAGRLTAFNVCHRLAGTPERFVLTGSPEGDLNVTLDAAGSPGTVNNFVALVREKFYDGLSCHRIITGFMTQCGDPKGDGTGGPGYKFADELTTAASGLYPKGTLAMANSGPNTNGSQFFIVSGTANLQPSYSVFGHVDAGQDAVLAALDKAGSAAGVPPSKPVSLISITVTEA